MCLDTKILDGNLRTTLNIGYKTSVSHTSANSQSRTASCGAFTAATLPLRHNKILGLLATPTLSPPPAGVPACCPGSPFPPPCPSPCPPASFCWSSFLLMDRTYQPTGDTRGGFGLSAIGMAISQSTHGGYAKRTRACSGDDGGRDSDGVVTTRGGCRRACTCACRYHAVPCVNPASLSLA